MNEQPALGGAEYQEALFPTLTDEQIRCVSPYGQAVDAASGQVLFTENEPSLRFYVLLEGAVVVTKQVAGQTVWITTHKPGEFTGEIALLTGGPCVATGRAEGACRLRELEPGQFRAMLAACPDVAATILPAIAQRRPDALLLSQQREHLAALGKMAAGLAHEINNPAAATRRAAGHLRDVWAEIPSRSLDLGALCLDDRQRSALLARSRELSRLSAPPQESALDRSDREDDLLTWLEDHDMEDAGDLAPTLADAGLTAAHLDALANELLPDALAPVLRWLGANLSVGALLREIEQASSRISDLVGAVKSYSYMDQGPRQDVDVRDGLSSTLTMLGHKLKQGKVQVVRDFAPDLPRLPAWGSELNQVWTNLLDNALDALGGAGTLTIRTYLEPPYLVVEIADDGPGIPPDVQKRIFEPFYTTKDVGKGTGLGLDIAHRIVTVRHGGQICVESAPGDTRFTVRLPLEETGK